MMGKNNDGVGHAWICDGAQDCHLRRRLCELDPMLGKVKILSDWEEVDGRCYNFYNWGWYGTYNGWYLDNVFNLTDFDVDSSSYPIETGKSYTDIKFATILR